MFRCRAMQWRGMRCCTDMPDCVVQNWRGATTRDRGLALGQPVLVSAPYYLDLHYPAISATLIRKCPRPSGWQWKTRCSKTRVWATLG